MTIRRDLVKDLVKDRPENHISKQRSILEEILLHNFIKMGLEQFLN